MPVASVGGGPCGGEPMAHQEAAPQTVPVTETGRCFGTSAAPSLPPFAPRHEGEPLEQMHVLLVL